MGGYIIFLGNSPVSWAARKHRGVQALSSTEAEIIQIVETTKELLWLQPLCADLGVTKINWSAVLNEDNKPASHVLLNNPTHSGRFKHMDIQIKFCGEVLAKRETISLKYVPTKFNFADIFTKPLNTAQFRDLRSVMLLVLLTMPKLSKEPITYSKTSAKTLPMSKTEHPALY